MNDPVINSPATTQQINLRAAENKFPRAFKPRRVRAETSCAAKRD
jgi:hypothetical protein